MRQATVLALLHLPLGGEGFALPTPCFARGAGPSKDPCCGRARGGRGTTSTRTSAESALLSTRRERHVKQAVGVLAASEAPLSGAAEYFAGLFGGGASKQKTGKVTEGLEANLLSAIDGVQGRGRDATQEQRALVDDAVEALEQNGGVGDAASSPLVDGSWRLIFTTTPGTASPVQRSFVGVDGFAIYQDIDLFSEAKPPTVTNVVDFGPRVGQLRVTALASTASKSMAGFVPRRGDGRFFGLNVLGVSQTTPPKDPAARIDFQFDKAGFDLKALPFNIPYPVPFRWLGDEVKGWIDVTYLSERLRIARGNKGTLFVLRRPEATP